MNDKALTRSLANILRNAMFEKCAGPIEVVSQDLAHHAGKRHRIAPILHSLVKHGALNASPDAANYLLDGYRYAGLHAAQQRTVTSKVCEALGQSGIPYIELKGRGLAEQIYDEPVARFSKDIDILVHGRHSTYALQTLLDAGFVTKTRRSGKHNKFAKFEMWAAKDTSLFDPQFGQQVELHQRLFRSEPPQLSPAFIDHLKGKIIPEIGDPYYVLYLAMHGADCHWATLKWMLDFVYISRSLNPSLPNRVFDLARKFHCASAISASIEFADETFPDCIGEQWLALAQTNRTNKSERLQSAFSETLFGPGRGVKQAGYPFADWYLYDGGINYWQAAPRRIIKPFFRFL